MSEQIAMIIVGVDFLLFILGFILGKNTDSIIEKIIKRNKKK